MFHDAICISHNLIEKERHFGTPNEDHTRERGRTHPSHTNWLVSKVCMAVCITVVRVGV